MSGAEVKDGLEKMLYDSGALLEGHFLLTSGLQADIICNVPCFCDFPVCRFCGKNW